MSYSLAIIILAFLWLLYETRLMTVRLPIGEYHTYEIKDLVTILPIVFMAVLIVNAIEKFGGTSKSRNFKFCIWFHKWLNYKVG